MLWGMILAGLGVVCYAVHAVLVNRYLDKNAPGFLDSEKVLSKGKVAVVELPEGVTPRWVAMLFFLRSLYLSSAY